MADLDEIMSGRGEPVTEQQAPAPQAAPEPVQGQGGPPPEPEGQDDADPISGLRRALDEERGKRRKYKDELANITRELAEFRGMVAGLQQAQRPQPQAPQPAPDFWANPDAALDHRLQGAMQPLAQQQEAQREQFSRMMAVDKFGEEAVNAAFANLSQRLQRDPNARYDYQRIMASPHPFGALVQWDKQQATLSRVGDDSEAFIEAEVARRMATAGGQPSPQAPGGQPAPMPSNFAGARSAGPRTTPQVGPMPLSEIMKR